MDMPLFSVIIPTLNEEKFLPLLLDSLVSQTNKNFEVIVVDGKSEDKTVKIAQTYKAKLPSLTVVPSKRGLPIQRNAGAKAARGKWFVFSDADSIVVPYFIDRITQFITKENPSVFATWFQPDSTNNKDAMYTLLGNLSVELMIFFKRPFPLGPLACFRRDVFEGVGGYDETHQYHEDVDLGLRLRKKGVPFSLLRETLFVWSLRRFRKEGTLKVMQQYLLSVLPVLLFGRAVKSMPGYIMGGQNYINKKKKLNTSVLKKLEQSINTFTKELFE